MGRWAPHAGCVTTQQCLPPGSFSPRTSFAGHLAGILVGLMYTHGPLKTVMDSCEGMFSSSAGYAGQHYYFNNSGTSGYQSYHPNGWPGYPGEAPRSYEAYTAGLSEEEQLERALRASLRDRGRTWPSFILHSPHKVTWSEEGVLGANETLSSYEKAM
ncbi:Rhomboid-related protein 4 [Galemys pyrenaicus]|uniref:Rhomboid-related protein 4 n=1 Tax=Galemys pyrenaicus TaxID=202257 RepID=A0A8J6AFP5_GALPY|nr:Rhomboid-related protein 4 [Galemys pyrenaicus]